MIKYNDGIEQGNAAESIERLSMNFNIKWHDSLTAEVSTGSQRQLERLTTELIKDEKVYTLQPFYTLIDGLEMGVADEILIRFLPGITVKQQKELHLAFDVNVVKTTKIYQKLKVNKGGDALEIANKIYETGLVEFATPNFISYAELYQVIPNDTYFNMQITCHNTGQLFTDGHSGTNDADIDAPETWEITTGNSNIIIAVLDQGVTSNHPDLPSIRQIRLPGSNFVEGNNDPSPGGNGNHGNACAGVIAATMNNNQGIAGIAPNCRIMPIRIINNDGLLVIPELVADAIELAVDNGAKILSNSWGYWTNNQNLFPVIVSAINYTLSHNRIVLFAAGNSANHAANESGYVSFPANVTVPNVITVGASDRNDHQANYSPTSNLIDIVAPSHRAYPNQIAGETYEMWSIDIPGNAGYNPWPAGSYTPPAIGEVLPDTGPDSLAYTARFGGTSHSCPVVAGVAALMLSVNPSLTPTQVFNILTNTADRVGGYTYTNGRSNQMGHGRVNARSAVEGAVQMLPISGPTTICNQPNYTYTIENFPNGATVQWSAGNNSMEVVQGQGTGTAVFRQTGFTNTQIRAAISFNGTVIANLNLPVTICQPAVNGPEMVCSGGSAYSIANLFDGAVVTWSQSTNVTRVSAQNSNPCTFSMGEYGNGWIGATVSAGGNNFSLGRKWVYSDIPGISPLQDPDCGYCQVPFGYIGISYMVSAITNNPSNSYFDYRWEIDTDEGTIDYGRHIYFAADDPGLYTFRLKQLTTCGWSGFGEKQFNFHWRYYLSFTPNPATGETILTIENSSTETDFNENTKWDVEAYSETQLLKSKQTGLRGKSTKINTTGWQEGVYLVRVNYNGKILTGKLMVKR